MALARDAAGHHEQTFELQTHQASAGINRVYRLCDVHLDRLHRLLTGVPVASMVIFGRTFADVFTGGQIGF